MTLTSTKALRIGAAVIAAGAGLVLNHGVALAGFPVTDLSIIKVHNGSSFTIGSNGTYTISVTNVDLDISSAIHVTDTLAIGLTFVSGTGTNWTCTAAGQDVTCDRAAVTFTAGTTEDITLTVSIDSDATSTTYNTAVLDVSGAASDPDQNNNTSTDTVTVDPAPTPTPTPTASPVPTPVTGVAEPAQPSAPLMLGIGILAAVGALTAGKLLLAKR